MAVDSVVGVSWTREEIARVPLLCRQWLREVTGLAVRFAKVDVEVGVFTHAELKSSHATVFRVVDKAERLEVDLVVNGVSGAAMGWLPSDYGGKRCFPLATTASGVAVFGLAQCRVSSLKLADLVSAGYKAAVVYNVVAGVLAALSGAELRPVERLVDMVALAGWGSWDEYALFQGVGRGHYLAVRGSGARNCFRPVVSGYCYLAAVLPSQWSQVGVRLGSSPAFADVAALDPSLLVDDSVLESLYVVGDGSGSCHLQTVSVQGAKSFLSILTDIRRVADVRRERVVVCGDEFPLVHGSGVPVTLGKDTVDAVVARCCEVLVTGDVGMCVIPAADLKGCAKTYSYKSGSREIHVIYSATSGEAVGWLPVKCGDKHAFASIVTEENVTFLSPIGFDLPVYSEACKMADHVRVWNVFKTASRAMKNVGCDSTEVFLRYMDSIGYGVADSGQSRAEASVRRSAGFK